LGYGINWTEICAFSAPHVSALNAELLKPRIVAEISRAYFIDWYQIPG